MFKHSFWFFTLFLLCVPAVCEEPVDPDQAYITQFLAKYPKVESPPALEQYATQARYDEMLNRDLDKALERVSNDSGGIAWGLSYWMMSLNDMYRATKEVKYLAANRKCIRAILAATDEKLGKKLFTGRVVKAWGSGKYADRGRALFAVHTGIITAPMFEFLALAKESPEFSKTLGDEAQTIIAGATAALAEHDRQWRDGPEPAAGHYVGMDQEKVCEGKPLPGNRLSAIGWALWASWKLTGNTVHRDHAIAIGQYIKHRLTPSPDGAYYWPYWLPVDPVTEPKSRENIPGEDSSHASLTFALPLALSEDGQVFTNEDMRRFGKMVVNGLGRLNDGILFGNVTGDPKSKPANVGHASRWLVLAKFESKVRDVIMPYYLNYKPQPSPIELAYLIRFACQH